uniref:Interleukin-33 n=1 Tax=Sciurus vulgaris TaxID=55149 RepID=A0A8D2DZU9_SCIVU
MKPKLKYSTPKISSAKLNSTADRTLVKPCKIRNKVLLRYHVSPYSSSESGDGVDGKLLMVNLSPTKDRDILLHANNKEQSVELQKCKAPLPDRTFFVLHKESSEFVSFECKSNRGMYIGVKDNHLALVEGKSQTSENIMFKL